jgi:hypothetical protein
MKRMLIGCCVLLAAGPAGAQPPAADRTAMYEDVEVMRRLLADAVARARVSTVSYDWAYPVLMDPVFNNANFRYPPTQNPMRPMTPNDSAWVTGLRAPLILDYSGSFGAEYTNSVSLIDRGAPPTDGTYLKGVGPVFTVTLDQADIANLPLPKKGPTAAANCAHCHGATMTAKVQAVTAPKAEPVDPWDKALRQVRGEPEPTAPAAPAARLTAEEVCGPGRLTELALDALAKYGPRFRDLAAGERLSVAFTVRRAPKETTAAADDAGGTAKKKALDLIAEGDLHAKQAKAADAVRAYQAAIDVLTKPLAFSADTPHNQVQQATEESTKALRGAHGKLAQLLLEAGKLDEAKASIEAAKGASIRIETTAKPAPAPAKPPLPTKLTVTLTKKALDDHKAGRLDAAGLRTAAEVEAVGFAAAKRKK